MHLTFNNIIEYVNALSLIEKEEIKDILEKNIIEEKREEIYKNYTDSKKEYSGKRLVFSSDIKNLKKQL